MFYQSGATILSLLIVTVTTIHGSVDQINKYKSDFSNQSESYFTFFTGGIPEILWQTDLQHDLSRPPLTTDLSPVCISSLTSIYNGLQKGSLSSYQFIDSSGKSPPGLLDGTLVSFGDFDLCLEIDGQVTGQYCLLQIGVKNETSISGQEIHREMKSLTPMLNFFHPRIGICVPDSCTPAEVIRLVQHRLRHHPVTVRNEVSCQTKSQMDHRLTRLSLPQKVSLIALFALVALSFVTLLVERAGLQPAGPLTAFSLKKNVSDLFKHQPGRSMTIDYMKLSFSMMFVSMHAIGGADNPYSPMVLSRMRNALRDSNRLELQIFFSDTLGEIMFLMSGYVTVYSFTSSIRSGAFSPVRHLLLKWSKLIPLILSLMALEFVWPLIGSGPFYPEVTAFVHNNCRKYWWANVMLIANYFPSLEKCAPQLFYSAVDFQLCIPAMIAILLMRRSVRAGIAFVVLLIFSCLSMTWFIAGKFAIIPNYVSDGADVLQRMDFMDYIHLPANTHAPAYFIGFLIGYKSVTRTRISISDQLRSFLSYVCYMGTALAAFGPALHNTFHVLPPALFPVYIVVQKLMYIMALLPVLLRIRE
jgi:hypothetical protein